MQQRDNVLRDSGNLQPKIRVSDFSAKVQEYKITESAQEEGEGQEEADNLILNISGAASSSQPILNN